MPSIQSLEPHIAHSEFSLNSGVAVGGREGASDASAPGGRA